jgi:hypothetical protein
MSALRWRKRGSSGTAFIGRNSASTFCSWSWTGTKGRRTGPRIPLEAIGDEPPVDDERLLAWLAEREEEHRATIDAGWEVILGRREGA